MNNSIEALLVRGDQLRQDGTIVPADEVRKMADGVRLFWDEGTKSLIYRGPLSDLPYRPAPNTGSAR